jgi:hypothetical protein
VQRFGEPQPHIPLLMFTNSDGKALEDEARDSGISSVAAKSEGFEKLLKKVNALLDQVA